MRNIKRWVAIAAAAALLGGALLAASRLASSRRGKPVGGVATADAGVQRALGGRLVDRQGRPILGAKLTAHDEAGRMAEVSTRSDADGRFHLLVDGGIVELRLSVEAAGFVSEEIRHLAAPEEGLELSLARRLGLEGVVRAQGRPVAGAEVQVGGPSGQRATRSGPDGTFTFVGLGEGSYALRASEGSQAAYLEGIAVGADGDAGVGVLTVELQPAVAISGRLLERNGKPIAGGEVTLVESTLGPLARKGLAGDGGAFRFEAVLPGGYLVVGRADGYFPSEARPLRVTAPDRKAPPPVEIRLERGAVIEGRVVDEQGRPVAGAQLEVAGEGPDGAPVAVTSAGAVDDAPISGRLELSGELGILRGPIPFPPLVAQAVAARTVSSTHGLVSDAKGGFRLIGLPAGKLVVSAAHPDFARATSETLKVEAAATLSIQLILRRGATVRGRVTDLRGDPLVGVELSADGRTLALSDRAGEFELPHIGRALELTARLAGYLPVTRPVPAGAEERLELRLERAEGRLAGVVVDERGNLLSGARIEVLAAVVPPKKLVTDKRGQFHLEALGPGPYRVRVAHDDFAPASFDSVAPSDDARLELQPGGGVSGELRDARTGEAPAGARLELGSGADKRPIPILRGHFEATSIPTGKLRLTASAPGYVSLSRELDVPPGERPREVTVRDVRLDLERGGLVVGRLRSDDGDPMPGQTVSCGAATGRTDVRGDFRLEGVPPGHCTVEARVAGKHASDDIEVRADEESRVDLRLIR